MHYLKSYLEKEGWDIYAVVNIERKIENSKLKVKGLKEIKIKYQTLVQLKITKRII